LGDKIEKYKGGRMRKIILFVCVFCILASGFTAVAKAADPIDDPPAPEDVEFASIETLKQISNKIDVSSLMGKVIIKNDFDYPEVDEWISQGIRYGFYINFPGTKELYGSNYWVNGEGEVHVKGTFPIFFKKEKYSGSFESFVRKYATTGKFLYVFYIVYQKDDKEFVKWGWNEKTGKWFEFDIFANPRPEKPKNGAINSKIFSSKKFEISYTNAGKTDLDMIKTEVIAKGVDQAKYKCSFEFYASGAYDFSTSDLGQDYIISKDGTFLIGFKPLQEDSEDQEEVVYGFQDFWDQATRQKCPVYIRLVIKDEKDTIVYRTKYSLVKD